MGTYQYAITKTKTIKGISEVVGEVGVYEFRYKYSWVENKTYEAKCARMDANIERKWAGKELPLVVTNGKALSIWCGDSANWCDSDWKNGAQPIGSYEGFTRIWEWEKKTGKLFPLWLLQAGEEQQKGDIPDVPLTKAEYLMMSDAYLTLRLRERGDLYAMPQTRNNPYWIRIVESEMLDHAMRTAN